MYTHTSVIYINKILSFYQDILSYMSADKGRMPAPMHNYTMRSLRWHLQWTHSTNCIKWQTIQRRPAIKKYWHNGYVYYDQ